MKRQGIKCFGLDEIKILLAYLSDRKSLEREFFLIHLTVQTGLRLSEIYNLDVCDVMNRKKLEIIGKGQKCRSIPLNADIRRHAEHYLKWKQRNHESLDPDAPLFVSRNDNRLSVRAIQRAFDKVIRASGISSHYTFHSLRHTFASMTYRTDRNIRTVQELLGHSRLDTTMVYTHVTEEDKEKAVDALATAYKGENTAFTA